MWKLIGLEQKRPEVGSRPKRAQPELGWPSGISERRESCLELGTELVFVGWEDHPIETAQTAAAAELSSVCSGIFWEVLAVTEGFEPSVRLETVQRFSKPSPSATRPRHQQGMGR
jgi:hypothetical protein